MRTADCVGCGEQVVCAEASVRSVMFEQVYFHPRCLQLQELVDGNVRPIPAQRPASDAATRIPA